MFESLFIFIKGFIILLPINISVLYIFECDPNAVALHCCIVAGNGLFSEMHSSLSCCGGVFFTSVTGICSAVLLFYTNTFSMRLAVNSR